MSITGTVFIQIDAHALIDAQPLHHQAPGGQKWVKLMIFVSKMHRSAMNGPYICNYSVLWWWFWGQILSRVHHYVPNSSFCSWSEHYYWNEYGIISLVSTVFQVFSMELEKSWERFYSSRGVFQQYTVMHPLDDNDFMWYLAVFTCKDQEFWCKSQFPLCHSGAKSTSIFRLP